MITSGDLHLCIFIPVRIYTWADLHLCGFTPVQIYTRADLHLCGFTPVRIYTCAEKHLRGITSLAYLHLPRKNTYAEKLLPRIYKKKLAGTTLRHLTNGSTYTRQTKLTLLCIKALRKSLQRF